MNIAALNSHTRNIIVDEVFPHAPETIWKTLTASDLVGRWLGMTPTGFAAAKGTRFTFQTTAAGAWDGVPWRHALRLCPPVQSLPETVACAAAILQLNR